MIAGNILYYPLTLFYVKEYTRPHAGKDGLYQIKKKKLTPTKTHNDKNLAHFQSAASIQPYTMSRPCLCFSCIHCDLVREEPLSHNKVETIRLKLVSTLMKK